MDITTVRGECGKAGVLGPWHRCMWQSPAPQTTGVLVKLKEIPFTVRLFKLVAPDGDIDWVITYELEEPLAAQVTKDSSDLCWQVEELHRELKQLTGTEGCQGRIARAQRNHLVCCSHAWVSLQVKAKELGQTLYALREGLFSHYLRAELQHPHIVAC